MIGLDTNILVRFFAKDDQKQFEKVYQLFEQSNTNFLISYPVLVEVIWVLQRSYGFDKEQLVFILEELNVTENFTFPNHVAVSNAIDSYRNSSADFSDCLIGVLNKNNGCNTTYTFDKDASELSSFSLLS